ncbi:MAG: glucose-1-phosphate cytidylyltransferase [Bacteroidota bacterium]|nr:glucose-1-phosphate cytidylyltransferase [Bacteroidota bacterium]
MKVVILAGGLGSRLSEETEIKPKPMVEIGGMPILWHIMKTYSLFGFNEFIILLGYKGYVIKEFFANYFLHNSDITIDLASNTIETHSKQVEPWKVTLVDTGANSMTGGRIKRVKKYIGDQPFLLTYGDGVADIDINALIETHKTNKGLITMTAVLPEGRYGALKLDENNRILNFEEKPRGDGNWSNGGFFVCQPEVIDYIEGDNTIFEKEPLEGLAKDKQLYTYKHYGFWRPMDTLRDKVQLESLIQQNKAPWIKW